MRYALDTVTTHIVRLDTVQASTETKFHDTPVLLYFTITHLLRTSAIPSVRSKLDVCVVIIFVFGPSCNAEKGNQAENE